MTVQDGCASVSKLNLMHVLVEKTDPSRRIIRLGFQKLEQNIIEVDQKVKVWVLWRHGHKNNNKENVVAVIVISKLELHKIYYYLCTIDLSQFRLKMNDNA